MTKKKLYKIGGHIYIFSLSLGTSGNTTLTFKLRYKLELKDLYSHVFKKFLA